MGGDSRQADVLKLHLIDGLSVRAIAKRLNMSRNTVRRMVGRGPPKPRPLAVARGSLLTPYEARVKACIASGS